jgi:arginase family enzyme
MMGMDVYFLNFDNTYQFQPQLLHAAPHRWIDLSDLKEANLYCSKKTVSQIRQRVRPKKKTLTFIGTGNYHHVTYLFLQEISQPFSLILFDHHADATVNPSLSCGSWVYVALETLPLLKTVFMIGVNSDQCEYIPPRLKKRIFLIPYSDLNQHPHKWSDKINTEAVYISIDKDVLNPDWAITNWDQGTMSLHLLLNLLENIFQSKQVIGLDVCGELPYHPFAHILYNKEIKKNEQANQAILNLVQHLSA